MSWANQFAHRVAFERDELDKAQFDLPHIDQLKQEFQPSHGYSKVQQLLHEALREAGAAGLGTVLTPLLIRVRDAHADLLSHYPDDHDYEEHCAALFDLIDHLALLPSNRTPNSVADGHITLEDAAAFFGHDGTKSLKNKLALDRGGRPIEIAAETYRYHEFREWTLKQKFRVSVVLPEAYAEFRRLFPASQTV